jgi:ribosomal protein S18 acetylase RimI-like enzyme
MIKINKLTHIDRKILRGLTAGYTSSAKYVITKTETDKETQITLTLQLLDPPYLKRFGRDDELEEHYDEVLRQGLSLGAYDGNKLVGIAIAEKRDWNKTLWVWEFHIDTDYQGCGIGTKLMNSLAKKGKKAGLRVIACETQNTNVPAIQFYRKAGFEIGGIDLTYYTNKDVEEGEVAIFMKKKLDS